MASAEELLAEAQPIIHMDPGYGAADLEAPGSPKGGASKPRALQPSVWEMEYASPWVLLANTLGVVGYQILSMTVIAYQVLYKRQWVMRCTHDELGAWLWACEYTKAYIRFFPLVAILLSMSIARSMILIQRMYYELLRNGAVLRFKDYAVDREPVFYVLTLCFVQGAANWLLDEFLPGDEHITFAEMVVDMNRLEKMRQWLIYLVVPMTTFILSIYFTHEPTYYLVPLSRYLYATSTEEEQAAHERMSKLILVQEQHIASAVKCVELPATLYEHQADASAATDRVYQDLIQTAQKLHEDGSVIVGKKRVKVMQSQILDRYWPAKLLFDPMLADDGSQQFRLVSKFYDVVCICAAAICCTVFARFAYSDYFDIRKGETEDMAALVVEAGHAIFALRYIYKILRTTSFIYVDPP
mmetsp:Transcript_30341/g.56886  ORF Transcript_30341/g.56886 Transcript_30341/m.56886 type:complete len:413 (+) Transcript_30341:102-1340(+)